MVHYNYADLIVVACYEPRGSHWNHTHNETIDSGSERNDLAVKRRAPRHTNHDETLWVPVGT